MQILTTALFAITVLTATMPGGRLVAQDSNNLVGTWKLVSASTSTAKGEKNDNPYGQNPVGFLTYTADGRMSVIITEDARKPLSVADRVAAPVEERADATPSVETKSFIMSKLRRSQIGWEWTWFGRSNSGAISSF